MKKGIASVVMATVLMAPLSKATAQDPISLIIKEGVTRAIKAMDLKIQRLQTKTIWLQNAQKVIENAMSRLKLDEITGWVEKQRVLYRDYFEELRKVKLAITYYHKVKEITGLQTALVKEYQRCVDALKQDTHFSPGEVAYMQQVYTGMIEESLGDLGGLNLVITSFATQMTDEKRLEIIAGVKNAIQKIYDDLRRFSTQNIQLSLARAKNLHEINLVKILYGLP